ncbi:DUF5753 domain-containing protein [Streptomyces sp. NPDC057197]|uniref:DUF5753 domain-containing protein n=1 Tax=Streptomyces sp. NPDC057197 TaxID=3346045 RepID=UPI00362D87A7
MRSGRSAAGPDLRGLYELAKREAHPDQYRRFMDFEAQAEVIETYDSQVVPGLLQTRQYAQAQLSLQEELPAERQAALVDARMFRKERLNSAHPPLHWAIIDESVLRWQVDTAHSKVQVMPFSAGAHYLMGGVLNLLTLPNGSTVAYEEGIEVGHLYEDRDSARQWRWRYEVLRARALSPAASAKLIRKAVEDYRPCDTPPN